MFCIKMAILFVPFAMLRSIPSNVKRGKVMRLPPPPTTFKKPDAIPDKKTRKYSKAHSSYTFSVTRTIRSSIRFSRSFIEM